MHVMKWRATSGGPYVTGHSNAGYACQVGYSPDGRFIMSGCAEGKLHFWDWKSQRMFKSLQCHEKVTIGCEWQGLTLVNFSAQPEPFLTQNTP
jgi:hypothetical protein